MIGCWSSTGFGPLFLYKVQKVLLTPIQVLKTLSLYLMQIIIMCAQRSRRKQLDLHLSSLWFQSSLSINRANYS